jgi:CheY-like chemotaxis protein
MFQPPSSGTRGDAGEPPARASSYVLVVDDEEVVRDFLMRCLREWGYEGRAASGATEALELMADRPAALVLCDIRMPGQDGLWLAERLRANWPRTAVVMATAIDDFQTVSRSRQIGVSDYVSKPIKAEQLQQVLRRALAAMADSADPDAEEEDAAPAESELTRTQDSKIDAEYTLESPVRCPACGERISAVRAIRLIRAQVNFTSTLPRRGRIIACPLCLAAIPAELTNF